MRDFYDIYILIKVKEEQINPAILKSALNNTFTKRSSKKLLINKTRIVNNVIYDHTIISHWKRYQDNNFYAKDISWGDIVEILKYLTDLIWEKLTTW